MAGVKEKSGGPRPGAGRPCKSVEIKPGDDFFTYISAPDGLVDTQYWTVESVSRTEIIIKSDNGDTLKLKR